jgi:putative mycofactocin binding protein MftB
VAAFDLDSAWGLHAQVAIRPERFGALLYHFGTRRLSFLKNPTLLTVVQSLDAQPTARQACAAAGVPDTELTTYRNALATLASSQMIRERHPA